ncbi:MAG: hypothetical protein OEY97_07815 [Nitrospirota bacterium]|nr:hypothetical protein [Nitrospirota bacterium]
MTGQPMPPVTGAVLILTVGAIICLFAAFGIVMWVRRAIQKETERLERKRKPERDNRGRFVSR